jgi:hypothetical protein
MISGTGAMILKRRGWANPVAASFEWRCFRQSSALVAPHLLERGADLLR